MCDRVKLWGLRGERRLPKLRRMLCTAAEVYQPPPANVGGKPRAKVCLNSRCKAYGILG